MRARVLVALRRLLHRHADHSSPLNQALWPDELAADRVQFYGIRTSTLLANESRWVHRRVERFELIDERRARRHMSVDFTLPNLPRPPWERDGPRHWLVPIGLLQRRLLTDFDVRDEAGAALPVLTREQNAAIAWELLAFNARETLEELMGPGVTLEPPLLCELADLAGARRGPEDNPNDRTRQARTVVAAQRFRTAAIKAARSRQPLPSRLQNQRQILWRDETMRGFMTTLAERFILLVPLDAPAGMRRIVKVSYEQVMETPEVMLSRRPDRWRARWELARSSWGLSTYPVRIGTRSVFGPESYHVEVVAPEELVIEYARLDRVRSVTNLETGRITYDRTCVSEDFRTERAHLYESLFSAGSRRRSSPPSANEEVGGGSTISIDFFIRPSFVRPPLLIGIVTCGVLGAGLMLKASGVARMGDVTALIVVLPALFAAYLIPGEHRLVRRMFQGLRFSVLLLALASFGAAASLTLRFSSFTMVVVWVVLLTTAIGLSGVIATAYQLSKRKMTGRPRTNVHSV